MGIRGRMLATGALLATGVFLAVGALAAGPAIAKDKGPPEKAPGPDATGKLYTWKAENGLAYDFFLPKEYDPEKGITLTFIRPCGGPACEAFRHLGEGAGHPAG